MANKDYMYVSTPRCAICGNGGLVYVKISEYQDWRHGANIQNAMSNTIGEREQLLTGTHSECFDKVFADQPEETYQCDDLGCVDVGMHHPLCGCPVSEDDESPLTPEEEEMAPPDVETY
jgi:hypothetical protein